MIRVLFLMVLISVPAFAGGAAEARQAYPGEMTCPVKLPDVTPSDRWTPQEIWAWEKICLGEWADVSELDGNNSQPCQPAVIEGEGNTVPENRVLRPKFLQLILTQEPWVSAPVKPQVVISCALIETRLDLEGQHVKAGLSIIDSNLRDGAALSGARFDRSLSFDGSEFYVGLQVDDVQLGDAESLDEQTDINEVQLSGARIGGSLYASGSVFDGAFVAEDLKVGGNVFFRDGSFFRDISFTDASVGADLQLSGSNFEGTFDLSGATIGELVLSQVDDPIWGSDAKLILRNTSLGALQSRPQSWKSEERVWVEAELAGLSYGRLGGFGAGDQNTLIDAPAEVLVQWLEGVRPDNMATRFDPGPYEQLAAVLDSEGQSAKADAVRFAKYRHRDANPGVEIPWWREWLFRPASRWLLGYGVYPFTLLWWFAGLVALGIFVARFTRDERLRRLDEKMWYSLENALPLVELNTGHKEIVHGRSWVEGFFHAQKILGFLFATLLIGALSLLTE
jgi:hypothetical protein